jgi:hypothetical protein
MQNGVFWDVTPCGSYRTDLSEELGASFIGVTRVGELGITLAVTSNRRTLRRNIWYFLNIKDIKGIMNRHKPTEI